MQRTLRFLLALWVSLALSSAFADNYRPPAAAPGANSDITSLNGLTTPWGTAAGQLGAPGGVSPQGSLSFTPAKIVNVTDPAYGAVGDGVTDDWAAIQKAEGMNAQGVCTYTQPTTVVIPPTATNIYRVAQAIRLCSNVTLWVQSKYTQIKFTGNFTGTDYTGAVNTAQFPTFGGIIGGTIAASNTLPTYAVTGSTYVGASSVTLTTPSQASDFVTGDMVDVETTSTYTPAGTEPTQAHLAKIVSANAGTGVITLDRPNDFASASVLIRRLTNGASTPGWPTFSNTNIQQFSTHDCGVIGGQWIAASATPYYQPFMGGGGGLLDCTIEPDYVYAGIGLGGNFIQDSKLSVRRETILKNGDEFAYSSNNSVVNIGKLEAQCGYPQTIPQHPWDLAFDESAHDISVHIGTLIDCPTGTASLQVSGTVSAGGGDAIKAIVDIPSVSAATVNAGGTGYGNTLNGTLTYSGAECITAPVLNVTTSAGGAIATVNSVRTPGYCTSAISNASTSWTPGGGINTAGTGATFNITQVLSYSVTYTTLAGDTLATTATGLATALNAASGFASANFTAVANPPNGSGLVLVANTDPTLPFTVTGNTANSLITSVYQHDIVRVSDAYRNKVIIDNLSGGSVTGSPIVIYGLPYTGTPPNTFGNDIQITTSDLAYQNGNAVMTSNSAGLVLQNIIHDSVFHGSEFQPLALQFGSNLGSNNTYKRILSDAQGGYLSCGTTDRTNLFDDIQTQETTPIAFNGSDQLTPFILCSFNKIRSTQINALNAISGELFQNANITNSGSQFFGLPTAATGALRQHFGFDWDVELNLSGTNATKPITLGFWSCSMSLTIPAAATGIVTVHAHYTAYGNAYSGVSGFAKATTTLGAASDPAPVSCNATTYYTQALSGSVTIGPTGNAGDIIQVRHIWGHPSSPFEFGTRH